MSNIWPKLDKMADAFWGPGHRLDDMPNTNDRQTSSNSATPQGTRKAERLSADIRTASREGPKHHDRELPNATASREPPVRKDRVPSSLPKNSNDPFVTRRLKRPGSSSRPQDTPLLDYASTTKSTVNSRDEQIRSGALRHSDRSDIVPISTQSKRPFSSNGPGLNYEDTQAPPIVHGRHGTELEARTGHRSAQTGASRSVTSARPHSSYRPHGGNGTRISFPSGQQSVKHETLDTSNAFATPPAHNHVSSARKPEKIAFPMTQPKCPFPQSLPRGKGSVAAPYLIDDDEPVETPPKPSAAPKLLEGRTSSAIMPPARSNQAQAARWQSPFAKSASPSLPERGKIQAQPSKFSPGLGGNDKDDADDAEETLETTMRKKVLENNLRSVHPLPSAPFQNIGLTAKLRSDTWEGAKLSLEAAIANGATEAGASRPTATSLIKAMPPIRPETVTSSSTSANLCYDQPDMHKFRVADARPPEASKVGAELAGNTLQTKEPSRNFMLDKDMQGLMEYKAQLARVKQARQEKDARDRAAAIVAAQDRAKEAAARKEAEQEALKAAKAVNVNDRVQTQAGLSLPPGHHIDFGPPPFGSSRSKQQEADAVQAAGVAQAQDYIEKYGRSVDQRQHAKILTQSEGMALMSQDQRPNERRNGLLNKIQLQAQSNGTSHPDGQFSTPLSAAQIREQNLQVRKSKDRAPLAEDKITVDDWRLFEIRNKGYSIAEIHDMFEGKMNGRDRTAEWFSKRYLKMKRTKPDMVPADLKGHPSSGKKQDQEAVKQNQEIADKIQRGENVTELLADPEADPVRAAKIRLALTTAPARSEKRSTIGGKTISDDMAKHYLSMLDDEDDEMDVDSDQTTANPLREPSPPAIDDTIHFGYKVMRRTVLHHQDPDTVEFRPWGSATYDNVVDANASIRPDAFDSWLTHSFKCDIDLHGTGLTHWHLTNDQGVTEVKIERFVWAHQENIQPKSKDDWINREVYDVKEKRTIVEETEIWEGDEVEEEENEDEGEAEDSDHNKMSSKAAERSDDDEESHSGAERNEADVALDYLFVEPEVDALVTSFGSDTSDASSRSSKKRKFDEGHGVVPPTLTRRVTRHITRTKRVVRNIREITTDVDSVHGSRERANKAAGKRFVDLQKELHPDPSMRQLTYSNGTFWQEQYKEMSERCDQEDGCISLECEELEMPPEDNDVDMTGGEIEQKTKLVTVKFEVWTQKRRFENPRNLL